MNCEVCDAVVHHYNSIFFPERMNEKANYPCFVLCFLCADMLMGYFSQPQYLRKRELHGKRSSQR